MTFLLPLWTNILILVLGNLCPLSLGYQSVFFGSSFSSVVKAFHYETLGEEVILYKESFGRAGYITEQWFAGTKDNEGPFDQHGRIRVYIDGEDTASLDHTVPLSVGVGTDAKVEEQNTPWSSRMFGHLANGGGYFNTFRIPFLTQLKITIQNEVSTGYLWYIVRGTVGLTFTVGGYQLPSSSRLRLYKIEQAVAPLEFVTLSNSTNTGGFLFLVTLNIQSPTPRFMEGCMRAHIDNTNKITFLSSGTEDFFLSAFYFNRGSYHGFQSGMTYKSPGTNDTQIVAYKFFVDDPILFKKSFQLIWRNDETINGPNGCPGQFPPNPNQREDLPRSRAKSFGIGSSAKANIQSYVWVYEWPTLWEKHP